MYIIIKNLFTILKIRRYMCMNIWSEMPSLSQNATLTLPKTTSPQQLFRSDCMHTVSSLGENANNIAEFGIRIKNPNLKPEFEIRIWNRALKSEFEIWKYYFKKIKYNTYKTYSYFIVYITWNRGNYIYMYYIVIAKFLLSSYKTWCCSTTMSPFF